MKWIIMVATLLSTIFGSLVSPAWAQTFAPIILNDPQPTIGGRFGAGVGFIGDIDGDGITDLAVSAPNNSGGRAYIFSGRDERLLLTIPNTGGPFTSIAAPGDVNGDGMPDIFVGGGDGGYVFSGIDGALIGSADSSVFFRKNRRVGDLTGDGVEEFFKSPYVFNGADGTILAGPIVSGPTDVCGYDATTLGDVNTDGMPDFAVASVSGASGCGVGVDGTLITVFSGSRVLTDPAGALLYQILIPNDAYGELAAGGDMNGDGVLDLLVAHGAYPNVDVFCHPGGPGKLSVFNGKDGTMLFSLDNPVPVPRSLFGFADALTDAVDLNDDGIPDILVGAPGATAAGGGCTDNAGQVVLFLSQPEVLRAAFTAFLHGIGPNANPPTLYLDGNPPTAASEKFRDSPSLKFSGGNQWKDIGSWPANPAFSVGTLSELGDLHVWLGLKNSDDQGTRFDLRAEIYKNGSLIATGETYCIDGVTRNPALAKTATVSFLPFSAVDFNGTTDVLTLKVSTRIGTNGAGGFCGGHSNAVGLRLYFDADGRPSQFDGVFLQ